MERSLNGFLAASGMWASSEEEKRRVEKRKGKAQIGGGGGVYVNLYTSLPNGW